MIPPSCRALRNGDLASIPAQELVKGDIVLLVSFAVHFAAILLILPLQRVGDKTPADLILFAATDLKVDNSSLTGESEPQERIALPEGSKSRPVEAENLVFNSTLVVNGEAWGVVVRTGDHTLIGMHEL